MSNLASRCMSLVERLNDEHADRVEMMTEPLPGESYDTPWTMETDGRGGCCEVKFFGAPLWSSEETDLDDEAIEEIRESASAMARYAALWIRG